MAGSSRGLERARRDARRLAADVRRLARRRGKRLPEEARERLEAACAAVDGAASDGSADRLATAVGALESARREHLAPARKPRWREYGEAMLVAVVLALAVRAFLFEPFEIRSVSMAPTLLSGDHVVVSKLAYGARLPFTGVRLPVGSAVPRRGDVIVFESPHDPSLHLVKRVVGLPGDAVELRDQVLYVNGVPQPRTPDGEATVEEGGDGGGPPAVDTCRRFREALARGALAAPRAKDPWAIEASWQAAAEAGVASYGILQCRERPIAAREGPYDVVAPGHVFVLGDNRDRSADSRAAGGWQVPLERVKGRAVLVFFSWGDGRPRLDRLFKRVE